MILIVEQVYIFLYAILAGGAAAFFYDILRIKRRAIRTGVFIISLEDIVYWFIAAVFLFITVYMSNSGEMRGFIFIGNIIGVILYETLLSSIIITSSVMIINIIKIILKFIGRVLSYPVILLYRLISVPIAFVFRHLFRLFRFIAKKIAGILKKTAGKAAKKTARASKAVGAKVNGFTKVNIRRIRGLHKKDKKKPKKQSE